MFKRITAAALSLLMILALPLSLTSCDEIKARIEGIFSPNKEESVSVSLPTTRTKRDLRREYFMFCGDEVVLRLYVPDELTVFGDFYEGFHFLKGSTSLGVMGHGAPEGDDGFLPYRQEVYGEVTISSSVGNMERNGKLVRCHRYVYTYNGDASRTMNLLIEESVLDTVAEEQLYKPTVVSNVSTETGVYLPLEKGNGKRSVLILGNYDVAGSDIGNILHAMLVADNRRCAVDTGAYYRSSVKSIVANHPEHLEAIRRGDYGIVCIGGFYNNEDVVALKSIQDACKVSGARLIIFPNRGEAAAHVENANIVYSDAHLLNWSKELSYVSDAGVAYEDVYNSPVAGFVGARLIYLSIIDEEPSFTANRSYFSSDDSYNAYLQYIRVGRLYFTEDNTHYFK